MCKIFTIVGITNPRLLDAFCKSAAKSMCIHDDDGFGYAAITDGILHGERWLNTDDVFKSRTTLEIVKKIIEDSMNTIEPLAVYNSFGPQSPDLKNTQAIIMHARKSTNVVSIENTHPFVLGNTALIHNGVISNTKDLKNTLSTCDSECILHEYLDARVLANPHHIHTVAARLQGWYACAALTINGDQCLLDVFKDATTTLHYATIPELGSNAKVYSTSEEAILRACKDCKFNRPIVFRVKSNVLIRLDAVTGRILHTNTFTSNTIQMAETYSKDWINSLGYQGYEDDNTADTYDLMHSLSHKRKFK